MWKRVFVNGLLGTNRLGWWGWLLSEKLTLKFRFFFSVIMSELTDVFSLSSSFETLFKDAMSYVVAVPRPSSQQPFHTNCSCVLWYSARLTIIWSILKLFVKTFHSVYRYNVCALISDVFIFIGKISKLLDYLLLVFGIRSNATKLKITINYILQHVLAVCIVFHELSFQ
jgi:hypothetical protein